MPKTENKFASVLSTKSDIKKSLTDCCKAISNDLQTEPDLTVFFVSQHQLESIETLGEQLSDQLGSKHLLGCTAESVVGRRKEVEMKKGLSVWSACLPNVDLCPFHLKFETTGEGGVFTGWPEKISGGLFAPQAYLFLPEPFTFPTDYLLERMNEDRPGTPVFGGIASGAGEGESRLYCDRSAYTDGAIGLAISGDIEVNAIVSQGCRPIGDPMVITKSERNLIFELGGIPAFDQLKKVFSSLPTTDQLLVRQGLHVGRVVNEYQDGFEQGDFLVRNVVGIDHDNGSIAVGDYMKTGQTIQFHVRDERSARDDFSYHLSKYEITKPNSLAALLFTCNGRGMRLFSDANHDVDLIANHLNDIPLAGFFAQGEIGPIGGKNFLHGFTASTVIFR